MEKVDKFIIYSGKNLNNKDAFFHNILLGKKYLKKIIIEKILYHTLIFFTILLNNNSNSKRIVQSRDSSITLRVSSKGPSDIFYNGSCYNQFTKPNAVFIDGKEQNSPISNSYELNPYNKVELKWTEDSIECECMFKECYSIVEMNFTNFNSSQCTSIYGMFRDCHSLTSLDLSKFDTKSVTNMADTFWNCYSLVFLDISNFDTSNVTSYFGHMFCNCTSLKSLNLSSFNTSQVTTIDYMFYGCSNLTSIDLSNFTTSNVNFMSYMFYNCVSLKSIDISHFDTSLVTDMSYLFFNCSLLTSINISKFITTKVDYIHNMFNGCTSLQYLDFANFDATNINIMDNMFLNCNNLEYLNIKNYKSNNTLETNFFFQDISQTLVVCIENEELKNKIMENECITVNCDDNLHEYRKKINTENNKCTNDCKLTNYKYEYQQKCYYKCPFNSKEREKIEEIKPYSLDNKYFCKPICDENSPYEMVYEQICIEYCNIKDIKDNLCILNYFDEISDKNKFYDYLLANIEKSFTSNDYDTLDIENGINEIFPYKELIITLTSVNNQKKGKNNSNFTNIDLGSCENILKEAYNISENEILFIKKLDIIQDGLMIPRVEYDIYSKLNGTNLVKLNISFCKNSKIEISLPLILTDNLDIFNMSGRYYNDLCYSATSDSGTDITLQDRKNEFIENNKTVCQENCVFSEYDYNNKKAKCDCKVVELSPSFAYMKINTTKLYNNFLVIKNIMNLNLLSCYKKLFSKKGILYNYGSYLLISIIISNLVLCILFFAKNSYKNIIEQIKQIVKSKNNIRLIRSGQSNKHKKKEKLNTKKTKKVFCENNNEEVKRIKLRKNTSEKEAFYKYN